MSASILRRKKALTPHVRRPVWQIILVRMSTTWLGCYLCELLGLYVCTRCSLPQLQICDGRTSNTRSADLQVSGYFSRREDLSASSGELLLWHLGLRRRDRRSSLPITDAPREGKERRSPHAASRSRARLTLAVALQTLPWLLRLEVPIVIGRYCAVFSRACLSWYARFPTSFHSNRNR